MPLVIVKTKHTPSEVWPFLDFGHKLGSTICQKGKAIAYQLDIANSRPFYNKPVEYFSSL